MAKKKERTKIRFIGNNAEEVTGSCILVETEDCKVLLECGLTQGHTVYEDYKINSQSFQFKPSEISFVFINHAHIDHSGLLGKLIHDGFTGQVITTPITAKLLKPLLLDSSYIIAKDASYISKKKKQKVEPFYNEEDIELLLNHVYEYGHDEIYQLNDTISFRFLRNSHIIGATQLELFIKEKSGHINKLLYTSDIGSTRLKKSFVDDTEFCSKANIVITESTYGCTNRLIKQKDREKDIEKIRNAIEEVCINSKGRILIPSFSLDRSQFILKLIYDMFHEDKNFNIPIILDSPLICNITDIYKQVLEGENLDIINKITSWKNVRFIKDNATSNACVEDNNPKVVISSSGFLQAGRSVKYLKEYLPNANDMIIFVGFSTENSMAGKIKNGSQQKTISIDGKPYRNRCKIVDLHSFSSHIQKDELINYLKNVQTERIYLVHGEQNAKLELKQSLEEELRNLGKTTKVICTNRSTVANL